MHSMSNLESLSPYANRSDIMSVLDECALAHGRAVRQCEALAEALEEQWRTAHADRCVCIGWSANCHWPVPAVLVAYRASGNSEETR